MSRTSLSLHTDDDADAERDVVEYGGVEDDVLEDGEDDDAPQPNSPH